MAASNTRECMQELIGLTITGVLFDSLPLSRKDLAQGTKTLMLDDGSGFTFSSSGSFWRETPADIERASDRKVKELQAVTAEFRDTLSAAGRKIVTDSSSSRRDTSSTDASGRSDEALRVSDDLTIHAVGGLTVTVRHTKHGRFLELKRDADQLDLLLDEPLAELIATEYIEDGGLTVADDCARCHRLLSLDLLAEQGAGSYYAGGRLCADCCKDMPQESPA